MTAPNPMRGEAQLGDKLIRMDFNGWCTLEGEIGAKVPDLLEDIKSGLGFKEMRTWIRVFLVDEMTDEEVGELLGAHGYEAGMKALLKAMGGFFPKSSKVKAENPPTAE